MRPSSCGLWQKTDIKRGESRVLLISFMKLGVLLPGMTQLNICIAVASLLVLDEQTYRRERALLTTRTELYTWGL